VLREEGVVGLWRGNAVTALKVVPCNALQFAIFHQMKDAFRRRRERREREARKNGDVASSSSSSSSSSGLTLPERLASGSVAGAISTAVCYPLDTLKSQMAVRGGLKGSALRAARQMFAEQGGARAFYKGLGPTLVADIVGTGLGFTLYDSFNSWYQKNVTGGRKPSPAEKGVLGGFSACVCLTATQPLEVVMTRMRVQGVGGRPVLYKNMLDCLAVTARREGWRSLWLGTGAAYAKIFPQLAITYYVFEMASEQMGVGGLARYDAGKRTGKIVTP
jgi:solute carrier family 25 phosphate transporter 23/24/25/41